MKSPRTPGAGITGTWISLGSGTTNSTVAPAGPAFNDGRMLSAAALDRQADLWLSERLAYLIASLRGGA